MQFLLPRMISLVVLSYFFGQPFKESSIEFKLWAKDV